VERTITNLEEEKGEPRPGQRRKRNSGRRQDHWSGEGGLHTERKRKRGNHPFSEGDILEREGRAISRRRKGKKGNYFVEGVSWYKRGKQRVDF